MKQSQNLKHKSAYLNQWPISEKLSLELFRFCPQVPLASSCRFCNEQQTWLHCDTSLLPRNKTGLLHFQINFAKQISPVT